MTDPKPAVLGGGTLATTVVDGKAYVSLDDLGKHLTGVAGNMTILALATDDAYATGQAKATVSIAKEVFVLDKWVLDGKV